MDSHVIASMTGREREAIIKAAAASHAASEFINEDAWVIMWTQINAVTVDCSLSLSLSSSMKLSCFPQQLVLTQAHLPFSFLLYHCKVQLAEEKKKKKKAKDLTQPRRLSVRFFCAEQIFSSHTCTHRDEKVCVTVHCAN